MPTYDYKCSACDHRWELFQSIKANPIKKCPACGKSNAKRMIGPGAGIIFKGSGFYQTDYRSESYKKAASADKAGSDGKAKSDETASKTDKSPAKSDAPKKPADTAKKSD